MHGSRRFSYGVKLATSSLPRCRCAPPSAYAVSSANASCATSAAGTRACARTRTHSMFEHVVTSAAARKSSLSPVPASIDAERRTKGAAVALDAAIDTPSCASWCPTAGPGDRERGRARCERQGGDQEVGPGFQRARTEDDQAPQRRGGQGVVIQPGDLGAQRLQVQAGVVAQARELGDMPFAPQLHRAGQVRLVNHSRKSAGWAGRVD